MLHKAGNSGGTKNKLLLQMLMAQLGADDEVPSFGEYAKTYCAQKMLRPGLRESTKRSFKHHTDNHLIPAFGALPIDKVSNAEFLAWASTQKSITRFFNARKCLVEILLAAKEEGLLERMPRFDNPDEARKVGRALSPSEVMRVLRNTRDPMFRLYFYTLAKMGCRPREILRWEWSMITWNEPGRSWIEVPGRISKCNRTREIALSPGISRRLHAKWLRKPESIYVFPHKSDPKRPQLSYHGAWRAACRKARVLAVPYDLRRTYITQKLAQNLPAAFVALALDTSTKMMEKVYLKKNVAVMEEIAK